MDRSGSRGHLPIPRRQRRFVDVTWTQAYPANNERHNLTATYSSGSWV